MPLRIQIQKTLMRREGGGQGALRVPIGVAKAISRDGIAKARRNEQQGYGFRGIDDVYNALSALLAAADLCILPRMLSRTQEERPTAKGGVLFYVTVQADFDFVSSRDGSQHTVTMFGEAMDSADKATNKAMSAAYKYCCMQVFCIPTESMADADATTPEPVAKPIATIVQEARKIDTGGHPIGTKAASAYVAQQKMATAPLPPAAPSRPALPPAPPKPWKRVDMRSAFAKAREVVGDTAYNRQLDKWSVKDANEFRRYEDAVGCYSGLLAIADADDEVR